MAPLHTAATGNGDRVVLVHGFTQTGDCWGAVASDLARDHQVVRIDAPGHGRSGHADASLPDAAELLGEAGGSGTWIGYSMGGRMALHVALSHPELVDRLVLIGATPGIEDDGERAARRADDQALADRVLAVGVEAFVDEWLALPLFAGLPPTAACREARLGNRADGLAGSLRHAGTGNQEPVWDRLTSLPMPVLWLAGAEDAKFARIAADAAPRCPDATVATVAGAGHTAHLERPGRFRAVVRDWLAQTER
jgi:2-succinyl-6-hydroxy-2,4-cyclohexadiene-1-carboxylate synthase